jgi:hypothetical protein
MTVSARNPLTLLRAALGVLMLMAAFAFSAVPAMAITPTASGSGDISGSITVPAGADPTQWTAQLLYSDGNDVDPNGYFSTGTSVGQIARYSYSVQIASDGSYDFPGLADGSYTILFTNSNFQTPGGAVVTPEFYGDAYSVASATDITISGGDSVTAATTAMQPGGSLSGNITDPNQLALGSNYQNPVITADLIGAPNGMNQLGNGDQYQQNFSMDGTDYVAFNYNTLTDGQNGSYSVDGLPPGTYIIQYGSYYVTAGGGLSYSESDAERFSVSENQNISENLTIPLMSLMDDDISDYSGTPVGTGAYTFDLYYKAADGNLEPAASPRSNNDSTDLDGIEFENLIPGDYVLCVQNLAQINPWFVDYAPQSNSADMWCSGNSNSPYTATPVAVNTNSITQAPPLVIPEASTITGTVTNENGTPLYSIGVTAIDAQGDPLSQTVFTDADGNYTLWGVPPGTVYLEFTPASNFTNNYTWGEDASMYAPGYSGNAQTLSNAVSLTMTSGESLGGINQLMALQGQQAPPLDESLGGAQGTTTGNGGGTTTIITPPVQANVLAHVKKLTITVPKSITLKSNVKRVLKVKGTSFKVNKRTKHAVTVTLKRPVSKLTFTLGKKAFKTTKKIAGQWVKATLTLTYTTGTKSTLAEPFKA